MCTSQYLSSYAPVPGQPHASALCCHLSACMLVARGLFHPRTRCTGICAPACPPQVVRLRGENWLRREIGLSKGTPERLVQRRSSLTRCTLQPHTPTSPHHHYLPPPLPSGTGRVTYTVHPFSSGSTTSCTPQASPLPSRPRPFRESISRRAESRLSLHPPEDSARSARAAFCA